MMPRRIARVIIAPLILGMCCNWIASVAADELVVNSTFAETDGGELPQGWDVWEPAWTQARCDVRCVDGGLLVQGANDPYAVGGVVQEISDIESGLAYAVDAVCQMRDIDSPLQSVLMRVGWARAGNLIHPAGMLVRGPFVEDGMARFSDVLVAPEGADGARLSLEVKWPGDGTVLWKTVAMRPARPPAPRNVKVGTVYLRPRNSTPEKNLELWCEQIDAAGRLGLDIVCLGEAITSVGTRATIQEVAQPLPGPVTERLGRAARRNGIWVVAGLTERAGDIVYNTAVLLDRQGQIAGTYRKVHLPREEWTKGVRPGDGYPVFETDFGTVAVEICYDWFFPEATAAFALKGAEIIFSPTWGNTLPDEDGKVDGESTFRVRARDNAVYMVPSVYSGNSLVIDPMGRMLASSRGQEGVFWAEVDLNAREPLQWVGHWGSMGPRHRRPSTYAPLAERGMGGGALRKRDGRDAETSRRVHAFYYPWYSNPQTDGAYGHWNMTQVVKQGQPVHYPGGDDIAANFYPQLGCYSSASVEDIASHMQMLKRAGVGVICTSWWGIGDYTDRVVPKLLDGAAQYGIEVCFHIEPFRGRNAQTTRAAIAHIIDTYGSHPAFYRYGAGVGRPMFYVYDSYLTPASEWATILAPDGAASIRGTTYDAVIIGLWVKEHEEAFMTKGHFDGFYTYFATESFTYGSTPAHWSHLADWARAHGKLFIPCVGPGYDDTRIRPWNSRNTRSRESGAYYDREFAAALGAQPDLIGITSFNEWHEGTQIEPAVPKAIDGYRYEDYQPREPDYYLARTRFWAARYDPLAVR